MVFFRRIERFDAWLLRAPRPVQYLAIGITVLVILGTGLREVPRAYVDFRTLPLVADVPQPDTYGTDTIADMYEARVVLNSVADMYTKALVPQTALEAQTWSKEASAPYPPFTLLIEAGLYAIGARTGVGFYGTILILAALFLGTSAAYALRTRWYIFPLLYLNCSYLAYRFVAVQDGSYLILLTVVMGALMLARRRHPAAHALMALAITLKLSPLYYARHISGMSRRSAVMFAAIVAAGLLLPIALWDNYLYIFRFHEGVKGGLTETAAAVLVSVPFALVLWYIETRLRFDMEDHVGWGLVPFALFLGFKMNVARHLVLVLLVPDKRGVRNAAAAVGLALPALFPGVVRQNSALAISTAVLAIGLVYYLHCIGWDVVRQDLRQPGRTFRMMWSRRTAQASRAAA